VSRAYDHVVLVSLDTLRSDCVGAAPWRLWTAKYDDIDRPPRMPLLDEILASSAFFPNCVTVTPYTAGAHASVLTGRWPLRHGVWEQFNRRLRSQTLFTRARRLGYRTLMTSDFTLMLGPSLGMTADVDVFVEQGEDELLGAIAASERSLALVHFGSMHVPYGFLNLKLGGDAYRSRVAELEEQYRPSISMPTDRLSEAPITEEDWGYLFRYKRVIQELYLAGRYSDIFRLYVEGVERFLQGRFARFWERLTEVLRGRRSLVVLFSDHGEEYDADTYGHFNSVAEGVVRVPVAFFGADVRAGCHPVRTSCVDIAPTVLALMGDRGAHRLRMDGRSLAVAVCGGAGPPPPRTHYVQDYVADTDAYVQFQRRYFGTGRKTGHLQHCLFKEAIYEGDLRLTRQHYVRNVDTGALERAAPVVRLERVLLDGEPIPLDDTPARERLERRLDDYNRLRPTDLDGRPRRR
jgi:choline-sulfatase